MEKSTIYAIISVIIVLVNMTLIGIPLIMFVALGSTILSFHYSLEEKKDRIKKKIKDGGK